MSVPETASAKRYPALVTAGIAVLGLPFYLGLIHLPLTQLLVYSGFASTAMATGQYIDTPNNDRGGLQAFANELALWFGLILLAGGLAYLAALIF